MLLTSIILTSLSEHNIAHGRLSSGVRQSNVVLRYFHRLLPYGYPMLNNRIWYNMPEWRNGSATDL
jgi:hypothetical protein